MSDATSSPGLPLFGSGTTTSVPVTVRGVPCKCELPVLLAPGIDAGPDAVCQRCGGTVRMTWTATGTPL